MPDGGRFTLAVEETVVDEITARFELAPGPHAVLVVKDTGGGMNSDTLAHAFEPFFTTRPVGQGTGLGLASTYGIVKQNRGHIAVESAVGAGTTFRIYLPQVEHDTQMRLPAAPRAMPVDGTETILAVEDNDNVRALLRMILTPRGYTLLEAANADEAINLCGSHSGPIHLVVSDVVLPGMSGPDMVDRLLKMREDLKVLFISGYPREALARWGTIRLGAPLLEKPFTAETLLRRVRKALDAAPVV
jgi:CheY-like chemotaxis protein